MEGVGGNRKIVALKKAADEGQSYLEGVNFKSIQSIFFSSTKNK